MTQKPLFTTPAGKPLPPEHHLTRNPRGKYVLRLTFQAGRSVEVGKRITLQLRTADSREAMGKRDSVIEAYKVAGILCRDVVILDEM